MPEINETNATSEVAQRNDTSREVMQDVQQIYQSQKGNPTNGHAVAALVLGILSVLLFFGLPWTAILSLILGIIGACQAGASKRKHGRSAMAGWGKALSIIGIVVGALLLVVAIVLIGLGITAISALLGLIF